MYTRCHNVQLQHVNCWNAIGNSKISNFTNGARYYSNVFKKGHCQEGSNMKYWLLDKEKTILPQRIEKNTSK